MTVLVRRLAPLYPVSLPSLLADLVSGKYTFSCPLNRGNWYPMHARVQLF